MDISSRAHSAKLPLSPASKRESLTPSEVRSLGSLPQEDVFNRIRTVAHDNIRDSEEKGLLNVFEAKQNKFKVGSIGSTLVDFCADRSRSEGES